jgi:hypothetical protein
MIQDVMYETVKANIGLLNSTNEEKKSNFQPIEDLL